MKVKKTKKTYSDIPSLADQYENIMKNFDFDRVQEFMSWEKSHRTYDDDGNCESKSPWRMYCGPGEYRIPTVEDLKECARSLLTRVMQSKEPVAYIATGPFKAILRYGMLELDCVIESWHYD